MPVKGSYRNM